jgi:hypothetical protein
MFDTELVQEFIDDFGGIDNITVEIAETDKKDSGRPEKNDDSNNNQDDYVKMFEKPKRTDSWKSTTVNVDDPVNLAVVKTRCNCCRTRCNCCSIL